MKPEDTTMGHFTEDPEAEDPEAVPTDGGEATMEDLTNVGEHVPVPEVAEDCASVLTDRY
jgi:hypothetical protein